MWIYMKLQNKTVMKIDIDLDCTLPDYDQYAYVDENIGEEIIEPFYEIYEPDLLPVYLLGIEKKTGVDKLDILSLFLEYIRFRMIEYGRNGFKELSAVYGIPDHLQWIYATIRPYVYLHGLSASDDYWFTINPDDKWEDVCPRTVPFDKRFEPIALNFSISSIVSMDEFPMTVEYSGKGGGLRRWIQKDGKLYLRKYDQSRAPETVKILTEVSNFLDKSNVDHVSYKHVENDEYYGEDGRNFIKNACECECFTSEKYSYASYQELVEYGYRIQNIDIIKYMLDTDEEGIYKILITNYIIGNNYDPYDIGFLRNNQTGKLEKTAPLFGYTDSYTEKANSPLFNMFPEKYFEKEKFKKYLKGCNFDMDAINNNNFFNNRYNLLIKYLNS